MNGIKHANVDREFMIDFYRQVILRAKSMGLPNAHYNIHGRTLLLNTIFGDDTELDIDGHIVKIIRDDKIRERDVGDDTLESELYLVDPEQLKANEKESREYNERYGLDLLIV